MTRLDHEFAREHFPRPTRPMHRSEDPLPRLLAQLTALAGGMASVERAVSRPWASALFEGRRHMLTLRLDGPEGADRRARLAAAVGEADLPLPGHFVADICVDGGGDDERGAWIDLSTLTIRDW